MKFYKGQHVVFRTTPDEKRNKYATRWEGMEFVVMHDFEGDIRGSSILVKMKCIPDFWHNKEAYFNAKFLNPVAATPLEADIQSYVAREFKELGIT